MTRYESKPMSAAPKDGTPIIAVCGGVEMAIAWDDVPILSGWVYWDEDDGGITWERVKSEPTGWRRMF